MGDRPFTRDATLVRNAIKECLDEAGQLLHMHQAPTEGRASTYLSDWAMTGNPKLPEMGFFRAQFLMARAQYLRMLDVADAAAYLRTEMLDAFAAAKEQDEHDKAQPKRVRARSGSVGSITPQAWGPPGRPPYTVAYLTTMGLVAPDSGPMTITLNT